MLKAILAWFRVAFKRAPELPVGEPPLAPLFPAIVPQASSSGVVSTPVKAPPPLLPPNKPPAVVERVREMSTWDFRNIADGKILDASGRFYFKETVLDELHRYVRCMKRMKSVDKEAYECCRRIGVNLIPDRIGIPTAEVSDPGARLPPWFVETTPAYGAVAFGQTRSKKADGSEWIWPRLYHFIRYDKKRHPPQVVAPRDGVVYLLTAYFDDDKELGGKTDWKLTQQIPVAVMPDGEVIPLIVQRQTKLRIHHRHRREGEARVTQIWRSDWGYPHGLADWAADHKKKAPQLMRELFLYSAALHTGTNSSMIRVGVSKGGVTALMNVDITRTPYFFKDRDPVIINGVKKRIFHIVRPHTRINGDVVHMHFRGLRDFDWNGYGVKISVPGLDHPIIAEMPVAALDFDEKQPTPRGMMELPVFADRIARIVEDRAWSGGLLPSPQRTNHQPVRHVWTEMTEAHP